jgi:hypothetical protein
LLAKTTELNSVVNVKLLDFWGGFCVGLTLQSGASPLADAVRKKLGVA